MATFKRKVYGVACTAVAENGASHVQCSIPLRLSDLGLGKVIITGIGVAQNVNKPTKPLLYADVLYNDQGNFFKAKGWGLYGDSPYIDIPWVNNGDLAYNTDRTISILRGATYGVDIYDPPYLLFHYYEWQDTPLVPAGTLDVNIVGSSVIVPVEQATGVEVNVFQGITNDVPVKVILDGGAGGVPAEPAPIDYYQKR